ncbi:MAG: hypothetical protein ACE5JI_16680, partial [Acidobacteriota bacterium]
SSIAQTRLPPPGSGQEAPGSGSLRAGTGARQPPGASGKPGLDCRAIQPALPVSHWAIIDGVVPQHLRPFFWDIDPASFDPKSYPQYTIARILEHGDRQAVRWLKDMFSEDEIKNVILSEGRLSRRSATFWALVYDLPSHRVPALKPAS